MCDIGFEIGYGFCIRYTLEHRASFSLGYCKPCPGKNCTAYIPKADELCPTCQHLDLVGKPPTSSYLQFIGGDSTVVG